MEYRGNIEKQTMSNNNYRKVIHTTKNMQLVLMSLDVGVEIGIEKHKITSQFIRVESGKATAIIGANKYYLKDGDAILVPPNTEHNIINTGKGKLKLYTIYTPPEHEIGTVEKNKGI